MDIEKLMNAGVKGIKPYVGGKPKEEVARRYGVSEPIKMNSNENPLGVSPRGLEAARAALPEANVYPESTNGAVREALARKLGVDPDEIMVGNGADEIIYYTAMAFTNDGDEIVIPRITFPIYEIAYRVMRAEIVTSGMKGMEIDLEDMLARVSPRTKAVVVCNPNNPTGHVLGRDAVRRFVERVPRDILILMDEAYGDFADRGEFPDTVSMFKNGIRNLLVIRTLSKAYGMAGFRVGYGIADGAVISAMNRIKLPFNITIVSQRAAVGALEDEEFLRATLEGTGAGRDRVCGALKRMGLSYVKSGTNFVLIDTGRDADAVTEALMKRGVIVRSARMYGTPTSIRVTVGTADQNDVFLRALGEVVSELS
jgi:histidinol-phosphate aminotransferase